MTKKEKKQIIRFINNLSKEVDPFNNNSIIDFVCALYDENKRKKVLIENKYGLVGNLLDRFKYDLDIDIIKEIFVYDINDLGDLSNYFSLNMTESSKFFGFLNILKENRIVIDVEYLKQLVIVGGLKKLRTFRYDWENLFEVDLIRNYLSDRYVLLECIKECGIALRYATDELKNDREIVIEAMKDDVLYLFDASEELQNDKELVYWLLKGNICQ